MADSQIDASIAAGLLIAIAVLLRHRLSPAIRSAMLAVALVRLTLPPWIRSPWSEALVDLPALDDTRVVFGRMLRDDFGVDAFAATVVVTAILLGRIAWPRDSQPGIVALLVILLTIALAVPGAHMPDAGSSGDRHVIVIVR